MAEIRVTLPYTPRPLQQVLHDEMERYRFGLLLCHRRFGKTTYAIIRLILSAMLCERERPRCAYIAPLYRQAKTVAWDFLKHYSAGFPGREVNEAELRVDFPQQNGARIQLFGADNPDSLRGLYLDDVVLDEPGQMQGRAWREVIRPALADRGGRALFIGTPGGRGFFYELYQSALHDPEWLVKTYRASETGVIADAELHAMRRNMSDAEYQQEMECFPAGTMVSTHRGQRPIESVQEGDLVLTHRGRLRPVTKAMRKHLSGSLLSINAYGNSDPIRCTEDHPFLVYDRATTKRQWVRAGDLVKGDYLVTPKPSEKPSLISEDMARLVCWYITEGYSDRSTVSLCLNGGSIDEVEHVAALARRCGVNHKVYHEKTSTIVSLHDTGLSDMLSAWCGVGAGDKRLPMHLLGGHEKVVFYELMRGDGCYSKRGRWGRWIYTTISRGLALDVQLLAASLGMRGSISAREGGEAVIQGRTVNTKRSYQVYVPEGVKVNSESVKSRPSKYGIVHAVRSIERVPFDGDVFNLSVKTDESYVADGRAVHNCSWSAGQRGAYYARLMEDAEREGRIAHVPYDPAMKVVTAWDLGVRDSTAIVFAQPHPTQPRIIDYYECEGEGLPHYAKVLQERPYVYGDHIGPHDIEVRELGTGRSRRETAAQLGINFRTAPNLPVKDGIEAVRNLLPRCWFDATKCKGLIDALSSYKAEVNARTDELLPHPLHDWSEHGASAFRYLAVGMHAHREKRRPQVNTGWMV